MLVATLPANARIALAGALLLTIVALLAPRADAGAIIDNGVVQLGVDDTGELNVCCGSSSLSGTTTVGVRYMATGAEATAPGCLCEGWGLAYDNSVEGGANNAMGSSGVSLVSFTSTSSEATSIVRVGDLELTQHYFPSPISTFVYQNTVTVKNVGTSNHENITYRREMDWDVEPTPFREYTTIDTILPVPDALQWSCTNGFVSSRIVSDPLSRCGSDSPPSGCYPYTNGPRYGASIAPIIDHGVCDHGAAFDFNLGALAPGDSREFYIYYGAADNEVNANVTLALINAEVWSLGQPSSVDGETLGVPNTFIFAFGGLNIKAPYVDFVYEFTTTGTQLAPPYGTYMGPYNLTIDPVAFVDRVDLPTNIDGLVVYRNWTFGDGAYDFVRYPLHAYMDGDNTAYGQLYTVCENITVTRFGYLKYAEACKDLGVHNRAPVPRFRTIPIGENKVRFIPGATDLDGTVVKWRWDLGDGTTSDLINPGIKSYANEGKYLVCLEVTDDDGSTGETCGYVYAMISPSAADSDNDSVADYADNCPTVPNARQLDSDHDGEGDDCDGIYTLEMMGYHLDPNAGAVLILSDTARRQDDSDQDGISNVNDNCAAKPNPEQADLDLDGEGDACDSDLDGDGVVESSGDARTILDNCLVVSNPDQADADGDGVGDACEGLSADGLARRLGGATPPADTATGVEGDGARSAYAPGQGALAGSAASPLGASWLGIAATAAVVGLGAVGVTWWARRRWS